MLRLAASTLAVAAVLASSSARGDAVRIDTKDGARTAILVRAGPVAGPTVIVLHGATIGAEWTMRGSGFTEAARARSFAAVFPEGTYRVWNDGREGGRISSIDDVGFLRRLVAWLIAHGVADPARIYLAGMSNGGMMTFRMLCEASELFAGAGTIIANMPAGIGDGCQPKTPLAVVMFNGTADPLIPYQGGGVGFAGGHGKVWSAERTAAFLADVNGCTGPTDQPLPTGSPEGSTRVVRLDWSSCSSGRPVTLYRIEGGGHQVFGHTDIFPAILGRGTRLISAPEVMLELFAGAAR
jgi:polyhydroxybutyrate depolymerase